MMASRIALHDELLKDAFRRGHGNMPLCHCVVACCLRRFDTENSGYIRRDDLLKILESESEVSQVMNELDVNHDGTISYEEFIGCLESSTVCAGASKTLKHKSAGIIAVVAVVSYHSF